MRKRRTAAIGAALAMLTAAFGSTVTNASGEGATVRVWLNGSDTPDSVREYLIAEFNELHPDAELVIEEQQWTGLVERLTTALSSSDSPDVVEMGNTQAQAFEAAGALLDLTEYTEQLGGDDLLQSLLEAGTYDGRLYGVPYYAGARIMIYRTDLFEAAGVEIPTTIEEMIAASATLIEANARRAQLLRVLPPRPQLARRPVVHLGCRRRHRRPGGRPVGRARCRARSRSPDWRRSSRWSKPVTAPRSTATTPTTTWRSAPARSG